MFVDKISIYGTATKVFSDPEVHRHQGAAYIPRGSKVDSLGLYDAGRKLILHSSYSRGPELFQTMSPLSLACHYEDIRQKIPGTYLYIGDIHPHYGHYLLSTMSRFWSKELITSDLPIIYLDRVGGEQNWNKPHIRQTLEAAGINRDRFIKFDEPCIIENTILPHPAFEEGNFAHQIYGNMCRRFGDAIVDVGFQSHDSRPIYISKLKLNFGVRAFSNELEICENFERLGCEIVYPETLSLGQQIAMWRSERTIISFVGSGHHSQIFADKPNLITINIGPAIPSTFVLCDWVSGSSSKYISIDESLVYSEVGGYDEAQQTGFSTLMTLSKCREVCGEVMRVFDNKSSRVAEVGR